MVQFSKDNLVSVLQHTMRKVLPSPLEYMVAMNDFLQPLSESKQARDEIISGGLVEYWVELCIRQAENDGKHSPDERIASVTMLCDVWTLFPKVIEDRDDFVDNIIAALKRGSRDKYKPMRLSTIAQMFRLLDNFSSAKNPSAPLLYKTLSHSLVENH